MFTAIFLSLYLIAWSTLALLPWLGWSVLTRGRAGLWNLPLCMVAGVIAALAVPFLGATGWFGMLLSCVAAFLAPLLLLSVRHWTQPDRAVYPPTAAPRRP